MLRGLFIAAGVAAVTTIGSSIGSMAAGPQVMLPSAQTQGTLVEKVQWRRCRGWRHECARRWGWGSWRFRRCMRTRGC